MPPKKRKRKAHPKPRVKAKKSVKKSAPKKQRKQKALKPPLQKQIQESPEFLIEESKYFTPQVLQEFREKTGFELPQGYGDNKIVLMVRDPYWLYAYWEISPKRANDLILRVYNTSDWSFFDIGVGQANNWYINVGRPNTSFCVDAGYLDHNGYFVCMARSNVVTTPRDKMSDVIDEEWMIPDWERMYALSGGFGRGKGSMEIKEMIERRQWRVSSS